MGDQIEAASAGIRRRRGGEAAVGRQAFDQGLARPAVVDGAMGQREAEAVGFQPVLQMHIEAEHIGSDRDLPRLRPGDGKLLAAEASELQVIGRPGLDTEPDLRPLPAPASIGGRDIGIDESRRDGEGEARERGHLIADRIALAAVEARPSRDVLGDDPGQDEPIDGIGDHQRGKADRGEDQGAAAHGGAIL